MTWSEQVHHSRTTSSLQRARAEYRQKRRGNSVTLGPDADFPSLLVLVGAVSGAVFCRREARKSKLHDWKEWPVVRQVLALVRSQRQPRAAGTQRHATAKIRPVAKPQRPTPAAAAAAAAMARTNNSPSPTMLQQRQVRCPPSYHNAASRGY
jgi:hypothetical protein